MARDDYQKALKKGERSYARYLSEGKYPYLQVLEELLSHTDVVAEEDLGICSIPSEMIVGTFTAGRRTAFAPNFMPLMMNRSLQPSGRLFIMPIWKREYMIRLSVMSL